MFELLSVLMCGGGGGRAPAPAPYVPAPVKQVARPAATAVKQKQTKKTAGLGAASGFGGTLLTGAQGIGDQGLVTGKSMLGG
tara:strand:- start:1248 stop:1493 length:246 start_codon:yes stop_codon:yes gene_type:complete